jgi:DNA invertase Pin-like site-specific DNA recombinase
LDPQGKLDRIGRSVRNLIDEAADLNERGVNLRSLDQGAIDTTNGLGKMFFTIMAAIAEFEADIAQERTIDGMEAARERHGARCQ